MGPPLGLSQGSKVGSGARKGLASFRPSLVQTKTKKKKNHRALLSKKKTKNKNKNLTGNATSERRYLGVGSS